VKVWIDLSNSPHPLLFAPVARHLEALGHEVGVTARDNAQTVELTLERWPQATIVGGESPKPRVAKARAMAHRVRELIVWAGAFSPDVALSHNSYGQILAAHALRLKTVTAMDYEGQPANHLAFRLAHTVLVPEALRHSGIARQGAGRRRARFYPGFKEELYLGDFRPDATVISSVGVAQRDAPLVVLRTPPSRAAYHRFGNPLFAAALERLGRAGVRCVALVRHAEQREAIAALDLPDVVVPDRAVDSRSLMYHADLVVGAGGTMTREAALMAVPTYSVFAGEQPAVDRELERRGMLRRLRDADELLPVRPRRVEPRSLEELRGRATELVQTFVEATVG
jgi:uncharacterized protein